MDNSITTIITISIIIISTPYFSRIIKLPLTPVEIILGSIAGYAGFIHNGEIFKLISEVGFLYLMFLAGVEVDLRIFKKMDIALFKKSVIYIVLLYLFSFLSAYYLKLGNIFIITMPLISVGLIISLINDYGKDAKWLQLSMIVGVFGEIVSITLITFSSAALNFGLSYQFYKTIAILFAFLFVIFIIFKTLEIIFWWYPGIKTYLMPFKDNDEKDIRISFSIFFILIAISLYLHLEIAFGAFIAGIFISTFFKHKEELTGKLTSFGFGFLVPLFFIYVGTTLDITLLKNIELIKMSLIITMLMVSMRVVSSTIIFLEISIKERLLLALSHSMPLTLLVAIVAIAYGLQRIETNTYYAFILASIFEVILSMVLIKTVTSLQKSSTK